MMNSDNGHVRPSARLELKWRHVATRLAAKVMAVHFEAGADANHVIDEFVIRQALREVLIDLLSTSFVSTKEASYPNSRRRMDLTVGPCNASIDFAIELKGTGASIEQLREDWKKMLLFTRGNRISILSGIVSAHRFARLSKRLDEINRDLGQENEVHQVAHDSFRLSSEVAEASANSEKTLISFAYIWHIGGPDQPVPTVAYHLLPV